MRKVCLNGQNLAMLIALNKPFAVLTQFTDPAGRPTLADYVKIPRIYAAGRLDFDSEGLLLLTDDGALNQRLTDPRARTEKIYFAQVEGTPSDAMLDALRAGVQLNDGPTRPSKVTLHNEPPRWIWPRTPPIRVRRAIPTAWLEISISEGRNRQVRRMTAQVGLPTLRLIRWQIGRLSLDGLAPGQSREINYHEVTH